jgi:hypothetical protein
MSTDTDLPPHLEEIGRQLLNAARALQGARQPRSRLWPRGLVAAVPVVAAAIVAAVLLVANSGTSGSPRLAPLTHPTAATVLHRAAFVALQTSPTTPSADQFVYTKTQNGSGAITQLWLSADGTHASIYGYPGDTKLTTTPGCVNGKSSAPSAGKDGKPLSDFIPKRYAHEPLSGAAAAKLFGSTIPMDGPIVTTRCTAQPAYLPDMPTNPGDMQSYLIKTQEEYAPDVVTDAVRLNDLAKNIGYMLDTDYLLPAQQAALYQYLAATPGVTLEPSVKDVAGRPGIGIEWPLDSDTSVLIFDAKTYQYLGTSTTGTGGATGGEALLQTAIVDTAGQLPSSNGSTSDQPSGSAGVS